MTKMIFINLPVRDPAASTRFYEAIGCQKNPQFSDMKASAMVWSEAVTFMLLTHEYYGTFSTRPIADARAVSAALYALSCESRDAVDAMVAAAQANGGTGDVRPSQDHGFMYVRTFADPDGNVFEPAYMDMSALPEG